MQWSWPPRLRPGGERGGGLGDAVTSNMERAAWWLFGFATPVTLLLFHLSTHCHGHTLDLASSQNPLILHNSFFLSLFLPSCSHDTRSSNWLKLPRSWPLRCLPFYSLSIKRCLPTHRCIAEAAGALPMSSWIPFIVWGHTSSPPPTPAMCLHCPQPAPLTLV